MIISEIRLTRYKQFENFKLEARPGLVVIEGPNEAGKTTIREAIGWGLFGGATRINPGPAEITLKLKLDNRTITVHRTNAGVRVDEPGQPTGGSHNLANLLAGTDARLFQTVFSFDSIDLQELEGLNEETVQQRLAAGSLFGSGKSPSMIAKDLGKAEEDWWRPRARDGHLNRAIAKESELKNRLKAAQDASATLEMRLHELEAIDTALSRRRSDLSDVSAALTRASLLVQAWPFEHERQQAARTLEQARPPTVGRPLLEAAVAAAKTEVDARVALEGALDEEQRCAAAMESIAIDRDILDSGPEVRQLHAQIQVVSAAAEEVASTTDELESLRRQLSERSALRADTGTSGFQDWLTRTAVDPRLGTAAQRQAPLSPPLPTRGSRSRARPRSPNVSPTESKPGGRSSTSSARTPSSSTNTPSPRSRRRCPFVAKRRPRGDSPRRKSTE